MYKSHCTLILPNRMQNNMQLYFRCILFLVVDEACAPLMNRGPPNITIIERSENTTVNQGPMQLHVGPPADETNSLVSLFKGEVLISIDGHKIENQSTHAVIMTRYDY